MSTLIADRFLFWGTATAAEDFRVAAIDLASGDRVRLHVFRAGAPGEQHTWTDACARAHAEGRLLDFGFVGTSHRFEVPAPNHGMPRAALAPASDSLLEWLEHARPSSPRVVYVDVLPDVRNFRLRGFVPCELSVLQDRCLSVGVW